MSTLFRISDGYLWKGAATRVSERVDVLNIVRDLGFNRIGLDCLCWPAGIPTAVRLQSEDFWLKSDGLRVICAETKLRVFDGRDLREYLKQKWGRRVLISSNWRYEEEFSIAANRAMGAFYGLLEAPDAERAA